MIALYVHMALYAYLTLKAGPDYLGTPLGYVAGAAGSYVLSRIALRNAGSWYDRAEKFAVWG